MDSIVLALGCNMKTNKVEQVAIGTKPWSGIRIYDLSMVNPKKVNIDNAHIDFNGNLIISNNKHVTKFDTNNGKVINKVNHIIHKKNIGKSIQYMITDGIREPYWISEENLIDTILTGDFKLYNAKLIVNESKYAIEMM